MRRMPRSSACRGTDTSDFVKTDTPPKCMLRRKTRMRLRLSTSPVDKPADRCARSLRKANRSKGRKDYGEKMTSENV